MKSAAAFICPFLAGCLASSSGVLKMGPDTYSVSSFAEPGFGGLPAARRTALAEANQHCSHLGREILVTNEGTQTNQYGAGGIDITFRCLSAGDPELKRPVFRRAPDTVIEDRRR